MSEKIDHDEARRCAEHLTNVTGSAGIIASAYLDLRAKALAYLDSQEMEHGQWKDLEADLMKCGNARAALLACLQRVMGDEDVK